MPTLIISIKEGIRNPSHNNQMKKKKKRKVIQIGREVKPAAFAEDVILYNEKLKDSTKKLPQLINKFSTFIKYKIII